MNISDAKIESIKSKVSATDLSFHLSPEFSSAVADYRQKIRNHLATNFSFRFNRQQLANLSDLTKLPEASEGYFSISHCPVMGGFTYSNLKHGFDMESVDRISKPLIQRMCYEDEVAAAPNPKFLWVAKEAALKALSTGSNNLIITDFHTEGWKSHFETEIFSYRINSKKTLDFGLNKGFVFSEKDILFGIFFK